MIRLSRLMCTIGIFTAVAAVALIEPQDLAAQTQASAPTATAADAKATPRTGRNVAASGQEQIVEGYAKPDYREMIQTAIVLGAYDINDKQVLNEYSKLVECPAYRKFHNDDFAWNDVRKKVLQRVTSQKESYRIFYDYSGVVRLGQYNFNEQNFPLTPDTRFDNIGHMEVMDPETAFASLCTLGVQELDSRIVPFFPLVVGMELSKPLELKGINIPPAKAETLLNKLKARGVTDRSVFVRFRFRVVDQPKLVMTQQGVAERIDLVGHLQSVDFFLDRDLTIWVASMPMN